MKDLNLGPDSRQIIARYKRVAYDKEMSASIASEMAAMLERWMEAEWCWHDSSPAHICGGPHVQVRYADDKAGSKFKAITVVEKYDRVGTTFPEVPHHVINLP